jgi:hypothetical protein
LPDLAIEALSGALGQSQPAAAAVAAGIAELHEREATRVEGVLQAIADGGRAHEARRQATVLLGELGAPSCLRFLGRLANDPLVREAAVASIRRIAQRANRRNVASRLLELGRDAALCDEARATALEAAIPSWNFANPWFGEVPSRGDPALQLMDLYEAAPPTVHRAVVRVLIACFAHMGEDRQRRVAGRLAALASEAEADLLTELAVQWDSVGTSVAVEALGELRRRRPLSSGPESLVDPGRLLPGLRSDSFTERADAVRRVKQLRCRELAPVLVGMLRDPDNSVRAWTASTLEEFGHAPAVGALLAARDDETLWPPLDDGLAGLAPVDAVEARGALLDALGALGDGDAVLAALLRHEPWLHFERYIYRSCWPGEKAVVRFAERLGPAVFRRLEEVVSEQTQQGTPRPRLLEAMGATGDPRARPWLLRAVTEEAWHTAPVGVAYLGARGRGEDVPLLLRLLLATDGGFGTEITAAIEALLARDASGVPDASLRELASFPDRTLRVSDHHGGHEERLDVSRLRAAAAAELSRRATR